MRKIFLHIMMSLDGYIEDGEHQLDWHFVDEEFEKYINDVLRSIDGMIFGRKAHQQLAAYWPTAGANPEASDEHRESARLMQVLTKYAISRGGYETDWENSVVIDSDVAEKIRSLKQEEGRDIALFGGASIFQALDDLGLVDEYRIIVNPIVLGRGTPLFAARNKRTPLELRGIKQFKSGAVAVTYVPAGAGSCIRVFR